MEYPVIRFDTLKDSQYPAGAWYATVDDDENVYDRHYGDTPDEALAAFCADSTNHQGAGVNTQLATADRAQILSAFGYVLTGAGPCVAEIKDDPEAFRVECASYAEALQEAYQFLFNEVDPELYTLPSPAVFV